MRELDYNGIVSEIFRDLNRLEGYITQRIMFKIKKILILQIDFAERLQDDKVIVRFLQFLDPYVVDERLKLLDLLNVINWYYNISNLFELLEIDDIKFMVENHLYSFFPEIYKHITDEVKVDILRANISPNMYTIVQQFNCLSRLLEVGVELDTKSLWYSIAQKLNQYSSNLYQDGIRTFDDSEVYDAISDNLKRSVFNSSNSDILKIWAIRTIYDEYFIRDQLINNQNIRFYYNGLKRLNDKKILAELKLATNDTDLMMMINQRINEVIN